MWIAGGLGTLDVDEVGGPGPATAKSHTAPVHEDLTRSKKAPRDQPVYTTVPNAQRVETGKPPRTCFGTLHLDGVSAETPPLRLSR
jgi:hypothetical protein